MPRTRELGRPQGPENSTSTSHLGKNIYQCKYLNAFNLLLSLKLFMLIALDQLASPSPPSLQLPSWSQVSLNRGIHTSCLSEQIPSARKSSQRPGAFFVVPEVLALTDSLRSLWHTLPAPHAVPRASTSAVAPGCHSHCWQLCDRSSWALL